MAAFRVITAEEEVATAIFHALVRRKYVGANQIDPRNHVHKAAVAPFFEAVEGFFRAGAAQAQVHVLTGLGRWEGQATAHEAADALRSRRFLPRAAASLHGIVERRAL